MSGRLKSGVLAFCIAFAIAPAQAHDFRIGQVVIDHPYATPSPPGVSSGAVYIKALRNKGDAPDRLIAASTPVAERVVLHNMQVEGGVMRMRAVSAIDVPAKGEVRMAHGSPAGHHLMLDGLKAPLKDGDRFELTLRFEKAGERTVQIWVQTPRGNAAHKH
jgi:periplasmic copper chaperone A